MIVHHWENRATKSLCCGRSSAELPAAEHRLTMIAQDVTCKARRPDGEAEGQGLRMTTQPSGGDAPETALRSPQTAQEPPAGGAGSAGPAQAESAVPFNRGTDSISKSVYALIFNGITHASSTATDERDWIRLSERERIAQAVYDELRGGGIEFRLGGLALLAQVATGGCPTCSGPSRETVDMVCQTCGTDYGA